MITKIHDIVLQLTEPDFIKSGIRLVANDYLTNVFNVKIYDGATEINYTQVHHATIVFAKPDNTYVQGNLTKGSAGFTYTVGTNAIAAVGGIIASVQLFGSNNERLSTSRFKFEVLRDLVNQNVVESTSEFPPLERFVKMVEEKTAAIDDVISKYNDMLKTSHIIFKSPVDTYADISTTYPTPKNAWTTRVIETGELFRYNSDTSQWDWIDTVATSAYDLLLSKANKVEEAMYSGVIQSPPITMGMNRIQNPEIPVSPKIEFTGFSYTNLLGKDGNCEDASKWAAYNITPTLDSIDKVFGSYGIKMTLTGTAGTLYKNLNTLNVDVTKYYLFTAYLKNGNATGIKIIKETTGGGVHVISTVVTSTTAFTRVGMILQPSDLHINNVIYAQVDGVSGQYGYVDGVMLNEITSADFAAGLAACMAKYPYVDSYAALTNPYFENRRYNLVRNGNGEEGISYWTPFTAGTTIALEGNKFKVTAQSTVGMGTKVRLKANTDYYLGGNVTGGTSGGVICIMKPDYSSAIKVGSGTFNSGNNTDVIVYLNNLAIGYCYYDSVMLVEGTTAPTEYKSCDLQRFAVEGQFTQDDKVTIENGKVSGLLNWKHKTLYGKDVDWQFNVDRTGGKVIWTIGTIFNLKAFNSICCAPGGKIIPFDDIGTMYLTNTYGWNGINQLMLNVLDLDSGWAEQINPNNDEVKAFMNGWQAIDSLNSRYICFRSVVDGSLPSGVNKTATTQTVTSATVNVTPGTGTNFSASLGNVMVFRGTSGLAILAISSTTADSITFSSSFVFQTGDILVQEDNGSTNVSILNYCKNNIAPGYEGYRIHYMVANPEPITDTNIHVEGEIWDLVKGDNYVTVDSGIVLGEVANPVKSGNGNWYINNADPDTKLSLLHNPYVQGISTVKKNSIYDEKWILTYNNTTTPYQGSKGATLTANFDASATYTVDYQILKTLHAQTFGNLTLSYPQSIISTLESHSKSLEQKQAKDSALDNYIDLRMYEMGDINTVVTRGVRSARLGGSIMVSAWCKFLAPKAALPQIHLTGVQVGVRNNYGDVAVIVPDEIAVFPTKEGVYINAYLKVGTINATAAYENGWGFNSGKYIADCRGRL